MLRLKFMLQFLSLNPLHPDFRQFLLAGLLFIKGQVNLVSKPGLLTLSCLAKSPIRIYDCNYVLTLLKLDSILYRG